MRIAAVHGLSPTDDFYLWGLLGLALSQPEPSPDFQATPYWCLKQLGLVTPTKKGSEEYRVFRDSLRRLAGVRYECDKFYDPIRREHREVSFGFLSYSLPSSNEPSRAWRFAWDPIFWELCAANSGALRFDIGVYRSLSPAARRFYLLLKKLFWRSDQSPQLEIRELAINTLGFSPQLPTNEIKRKLIACVQELSEQGLVDIGQGQKSAGECVTKKSKGLYSLQVNRGPNFNKTSRAHLEGIEDSPLYDQLVAVGFEQTSIARIIANYPAKQIQLWSDITLAAAEQGRITGSPQAFFTYYVQRAKEGVSTPPDWWRDIERQRCNQEAVQRQERASIHSVAEEGISFEEYLKSEARDSFEQVMKRLETDLLNAGKSRGEAESFAREHATIHLKNLFRQKRSSTSTVK